MIITREEITLKCYSEENMSDITIGATGHRTITHDVEKVREELKNIFLVEKPSQVISGMALGYDTVFVEVAMELGIPFIAAVPFAEQASVWPEKERQHYLDLLSKAKDIYIHPETKVGNKVYAGYFGRNRWIVEHSQLLVAYMINSEDGGTAHTWKYAVKKGLRTINLVDRI